MVGKENETSSTICYQVGAAMYCGEEKHIIWSNQYPVKYLGCKAKKSQACLLTLDFFKAYDRVFLNYLIKVMKKMNFGTLFTSWISMLHEGATTRFIIAGLTRAIQLFFSIRQGDPIAMLLYIIYVEPLLQALEKKMTGLKVAGIGKSLEAYCDDINVLTDKLADFDI